MGAASRQTGVVNGREVLLGALVIPRRRDRLACGEAELDARATDRSDG